MTHLKNSCKIKTLSLNQVKSMEIAQTETIPIIMLTMSEII